MLIVVGCSYARRCAPRIAVIVVTLIYLTIIHNHNSSGFRLAHFRGQERRLTLADHSANLSVDCQLNMLHNLSLSFSVSTYLIQSLSFYLSLCLSFSLFHSTSCSYICIPLFALLALSLSLYLPISSSLSVSLSFSLCLSLHLSFTLFRSFSGPYICLSTSLTF